MPTGDEKMRRLHACRGGGPSLRNEGVVHGFESRNAGCVLFQLIKHVKTSHLLWTTRFLLSEVFLTSTSTSPNSETTIRLFRAHQVHFDDSHSWLSRVSSVNVAADGEHFEAISVVRFLLQASQVHQIHHSWTRITKRLCCAVRPAPFPFRSEPNP